MNIFIRNSYEPPTIHPDVRIIIDVFRASSTAVAILETEPSDFLITNSLETLQDLIKKSYRVVSEVYDLGLSNSASQVKESVQLGEKIVQKTTNLTTAIEANYFTGTVLIACFNNLTSVANFVRKSKFQTVEIIPAGQVIAAHTMPEDTHCAELLKDMLLLKKDLKPNLDLLLGNWEETKKIKK